MNRRKESPLAVISFAANVLIVATTVTALYIAQSVFIPLTLATMLAFLLAPLADRLETRGLGRVPAVVVIALIAFSIISGFVWVVGREATKLAANMPQYQTEIVAKVESFSSMGSSTSKRMGQLVSAVSRALRGEPSRDAQSKPDAAPPVPTTPVDDLDAKSTAAVVQEAQQSKEEAETPAEPGSPENPLHVIAAESQATPAGTAGTILGALTAVLSPLTTVGLVFVFTIFMLLARDDLRDRMIRLLSGGRYIVTTKAIDEASRRISSYIRAQTILNSLYGLCIGFGLWVIGMTLGGDKGFPNFALWGLLCTVLRFVPYVGPIVAGAFPILLSLTIYPGFGVFTATALLFVAVELSSNNVIEPWLYGTSTGMSAVAIIIAAVFWTWMWGPVGLLLATPLTASLVVLGKYVPQLRPLTVLLGDKTPLPPFVSFYQRLLADDAPRAAKIVELAIEESDVETAADEVLLPAIRRVRRDRAREGLSAPREHRLMQQINEMIDDVLASHCETLQEKKEIEKETASGDAKEAQAAQPETQFVVPPGGRGASIGTTLECEERVAEAITHEDVAHYSLTDDQPEPCDVVGCAAHHESEEPALKLLAYCLSEHNVEMRWAGTRALPTDVEDWIEKIQPKVIVIAIVPPGGFIQAKYMCERLHERLPSSQIVVAYFGKLQKYDANLIKFRRSGANYFTTSLNQTRTQIVNALHQSAAGKLAARGQSKGERSGSVPAPKGMPAADAASSQVSGTSAPPPQQRFESETLGSNSPNPTQSSSANSPSSKPLGLR